MAVLRNHARPLCFFTPLLLCFGAGGCSDAVEGSSGLPTCDTATMAGAPVVALDWDELVETHLAPGTVPDTLVFDYFVFPAPAVNFVQLTPEFDPTVTLDSLELRSVCPRTLPTSTLTAWADNEVITAGVLAGHDESPDVRRGRITLANGSRSMQIDTSPVDADEGWWFVFEPGRGSSRIVLLPARMGGTLEVQGLPRVAAEVALVRTDELVWDADNRVAYSPPGFAADWRSSVSDWYGTVIFDWEESESITLPTVAENQGIGVPSRSIRLGTELDDANPSALLRITGNDPSGMLTLPCAEEVDFRASGFVDVEVDDGSRPFSVAPGSAESLALDCLAGETTGTVSVSGTVLNGRTGFLVAQLLSGRGSR